jgi:large subunit ribosomal protein L10
VVKNKLAARAAKGTKIEAALQGLKGVSSVAYTSGDPVALAKALSTWVKDNAEFTFKLGIVDGKVITVDEIKALATLPGKEELFSKLLFLIQSPAQRLVTVINASGRDLAVVINQAWRRASLAAPRRHLARRSRSCSPVAKPLQGLRRLKRRMWKRRAGEQPSGAAQPENATASQAGEAACHRAGGRRIEFRFIPFWVRLAGALVWAQRKPGRAEAAEAEVSFGDTIGSSNSIKF